MVVDTQTQVVTPQATQVVTPILRRIVSRGVFEKPPNPFLTTKCSPSCGFSSSMICAPHVPSTQCVRLPLQARFRHANTERRRPSSRALVHAPNTRPAFRLPGVHPPVSLH